MVSRSTIDDFIAQRKLAIVGVSRSGKKFGNRAYLELKSRGYSVYPVNPNTVEIEGDRCYSSLSDLPEPVEGVVVVVPPVETEKVVQDALKAGIPRVWMQQGADSEEAVRFCEEQGISVVHGHCILMFAEPVTSFHRFHRWVWSLLGKLPR